MFLYVLVSLCIMAGICVPPSLALIADKAYEEWKKDKGYVNNGDDKNLFRDFKNLSDLGRVLCNIALFIPVLNIIVSSSIAHRRMSGKTIREEINMGLVSEYEEIIPFGDVEVVEGEVVSDEEEVVQESDFSEEELIEMAELFSDMLVASMLASAVSRDWGDSEISNDTELLDIINGVEQEKSDENNEYSEENTPIFRI